MEYICLQAWLVRLHSSPQGTTPDVDEPYTQVTRIACFARSPMNPPLLVRVETTVIRRGERFKVLLYTELFIPAIQLVDTIFLCTSLHIAELVVVGATC